MLHKCSSPSTRCAAFVHVIYRIYFFIVVLYATGFASRTGPRSQALIVLFSYTHVRLLHYATLLPMLGWHSDQILPLVAHMCPYRQLNLILGLYLLTATKVAFPIGQLPIFLVVTTYPHVALRLMPRCGALAFLFHFSRSEHRRLF